ncbi:M20/M25/M40 family metallo-hydrolase [Chitinophaga agrisoli]|uniref:M20/M25/M40 family metallo-hydrolase n=1 Tax=Chitinophaga agrisoli TaxID=2607653 RepID=A0A5B2W5Z3_9BACT|nr:M20/M25/M40 family metallo-hydrolase [Chitinophaga agrisoli]KAA2245639.1 M20/M25/M40 family metallo-hydrolase [Chitinophaga agrisoli]
MYRIWLTVFAMAFSITPARSQDTISSTEVRRIISTLAADDMQGRKTFSPGIDKAATFIEQEYQKAGLQTWQGAKGYRQTFYMYRIKPVSIQLTINGEKRISDNVIIKSSAGQLSWNQEGQVAEQHIRSADNFFNRVRELRQQKGNTIIWVDAAQRQNFSQYRQYLQDNIQMADSGNLVLVLQEEADTAIRSVNLEVRQQVTPVPLFNVVGVIPGSSKPDEYVIFSAHYDHIGILKPVEQDSIANGADDDASGTTAVIMLANYYKQLKPARTLIFAAFTGEEMGSYGARYFSQQMNPDKVVAMFNIEMIGKEAKFGKNSAFITGFERSDFGAILQRNLEGSVFHFHPDPYPDQNLFYRSDNATLARLGVPAHTISTDQIDTDSLYHSVNDEVESLDMENITNTINAIAKSAVSIVEGKDTPTRIKPEQ